MPIFEFEAMDATGEEIKDIIKATNEADAQSTIRQMGYFVTKIVEQEDKDDKFNLSPSSSLDDDTPAKARSATKFLDGISFDEISRIMLRCIVAVMLATLLFSFAKTQVFNHNLFIEAILLAIYNKLIK